MRGGLSVSRPITPVAGLGREPAVPCLLRQPLGRFEGLEVAEKFLVGEALQLSAALAEEEGDKPLAVNGMCHGCLRAGRCGRA